MTRSPFILAGVAALMGAAGVALAAAGVHANGGELAREGRALSPVARMRGAWRSPRTLGSRPLRRARL